MAPAAGEGNCYQSGTQTVEYNTINFAFHSVHKYIVNNEINNISSSICCYATGRTADNDEEIYCSWTRARRIYF